MADVTYLIAAASFDILLNMLDCQKYFRGLDTSQVLAEHSLGIHQAFSDGTQGNCFERQPPSTIVHPLEFLQLHVCTESG